MALVTSGVSISLVIQGATNRRFVETRNGDLMYKIDADLRQEIKDTLEHFDVDDMHMYAGAQTFLDSYKQTVDLQDFLEFANEDLTSLVKVPETLLGSLNVHPLVELTLGEGLYATQFRLIQPEIQMACSASVGVRVVSAIASENEDVLNLLAVDPCYLVRLSAYENPNSARELVERLRNEDPYFRVFTADEIEEMGVDYEELATVEDCGCTPAGVNDFIHKKYSDELLEIPPLAHEFEKRMGYFGAFNFGTQPSPSPIEDYLFLDILDYLKGPLPDQYVLNHAGHGVNSYSLNFRYALGDLAVLMQVAYGGAYGDTTKDAKNWDDCVNHIGDIMLLNPEGYKEGLWQRKYILLYSNFRGDHLNLLTFRDGSWVEIPLVKTWEEAKEYFSFWDENHKISS